jgi:hypothetical protein
MFHLFMCIVFINIIGGTTMNYFRIILSGLVSLLLLSHSSWAQITITRGNLEVLFAENQQGFIYADTSDSVFQVNIGETGGPHVYDFSDFQFSKIDSVVTMPISQIPQLIPRYPADAIAVRFTEDSETNEYEYFTYRILDDGIFSPGAANISTQSERYRHYVPEELNYPYPMTFGYSTSYSIMEYDTTYVGGGPTEIDLFSTSVTKDVDGWGTLVLPGFGSFNCIRMKAVDLPPAHRKDFIFFTHEGYLLNITSNNTESDSGLISSDEIILIVPQSVVGVEQSSEIPREFNLLQNYPNPFNPSTTIRYDLPKASRVSLAIYDILGREVVRLVDIDKPAGYHQAAWNGKNSQGGAVPSGIYIYQIVADAAEGKDRFMMVKKSILLK